MKDGIVYDAKKLLAPVERVASEAKKYDVNPRERPMSILSFFRRKPKPSPAPPPSVRCMILTQREEPPDEAMLRNAMRRFGPEASCFRKDEFWMLKMPGVERAGVAFVPTPVPDGTAEAAADDPLWSDGPAEAKHRSYAGFACKASQGGLIESAFLLTAIVREMLDAFEGTAVYWPAGAITVPRQRFDYVAAFATREQLPLELWCRFAPFRVDDEHGGLHTIGLSQFGSMEIEVERSSWRPRELSDFVKKVANYVLTSGTVVKHGDTIGKDAGQKIVVHHGVSKLTGRDVYKVLTP